MNFQRELLALRSSALVLDYCLVPWDSEIFGFPVAQIERMELKDAGASSEFEEFERWLDLERVHLVSCRLPHACLAESMFLEGRGFRFVEMVYSPRLDRLDRVETMPSALRIEPAGPGDMAAICDIAAHAFATGRFLLDGRLDRRLSAKRYRAWIQNSFEDPAHEVLKVELDANLVGFFVVQARSDGCVYWHLTAIAPHWQGRGIGTQLWPAMLARFRDAGMRAVETTISAHNTPVLNLYARLGFRFQPAQMTFHWLRGHGQAPG